MYSILIVDDEDIILEGIKEVIEGAELPQLKEVRTASSAVEAMSMYREEPADILLADISMPQVNGLSMAEEIKRLWPYTEIIFLTGFQNFSYAREALRLKSFEYLLKPISDDELLACIRAVIASLDERWKKEFVYSYGNEIEIDGKGDLIASELKLQVKQRRNDFKALIEKGLPFSRERKLRAVVFFYKPEIVKEEATPIHAWITEALKKCTYSYGYVCGFSADAHSSVFLIQKTVESDALFTGVYEGLEKLQSDAYTRLSLNMSILVSHRILWDEWIETTCGMLAERERIEKYGILSKYESDNSPQFEESGNLLMYRVRDYILEHPGEDLSLGRLAVRFRINPSYLSRSFHQTIGIKLSAFVAQTRVNKAKSCLRKATVV